MTHLVTERKQCGAPAALMASMATLNRAISTIFKTDRTREARRQFAMNLGFSSPRANGTPAHQIGQILRRDHIEEFAGGQAGRCR
ncbi:Uncharacterised protein [Salmonella enterica subsp. enterica]|uniref:Uncharacterized protein n=1 Tax=Salmonella enterica I TaxID=59201 RepID=A0A379VTT7_SALET|nr:Uncharacterised protein [Salmonella enterica subsp. enterica]